MPLLAIDELLTDPDFTSYLYMVETRSQVGQDGMAQNFKYKSRFIGIVDPAGATELQRAPEGMNTTGALIVITNNTNLTAGDAQAGTQPSQVQWHGQLYLVRQIDDYSEYGKGFVKAMLERQGINA